MTNEEEKILEEENDITLEDAAEEAKELQEETQDEVKEVREEIPDDVRLDPDEIRERPVLRGGGLRDARDPNMIQTHMDNFLAKIVGETPVDDNPRNSTEYWLNEIANAGFRTMPDLLTYFGANGMVGGTLRQCLCVKETLDFDDTDCVDLSSLTWAYYPDNTLFYSNVVSGIKLNGAKIICTKYKNGIVSLTETNPDLIIGVANDGTLRLVDNSAGTDPSALKVFLQGVLVAFEKA